MTEYKCGSAKQCQFGDMCKPPYDIGGCSHYREKRPQTNEEWLQTCTTEQFAEFLAGIINTNPCGYLLSCNECGLNDRCCEDDYPSSKEAWVEWLKQPHTFE